MFITQQKSLHASVSQLNKNLTQRDAPYLVARSRNV